MKFQHETESGDFYGALAILIALKTACMPVEERDKFLNTFEICLAAALHEFKACDCFELDPPPPDVN